MDPGDPPFGRALTGRRLLWVAVGLLATLAAVPGAWAASTYGADTSADEPHYLLTAIALADRGSLDIGPEVRAETWRSFHAAELPQQAAVGEHGRLVAPHDPLLPALLAGPVRLAGWRGGRLALAVVNGLLAVGLAWTATHRLRVPAPLAAGVALIACASAPFVVYGSQVYPELPAALAVTAAGAAGLGPLRAATAAGVVAAVIALPWLSVKYVPVAAVLAVLHLMALRRGGRRRLMTACITAYAAAGILYVLAHLAWYGGLTVYAAGDFFAAEGGQLSVLGTEPNYLGRARRLLGLMVDRQFGLAAWQPAWLLLVPAMVAVLRRRPPGWAWLAAPLATGWLMATFAAVTMHGWWFPGRHVLHALPVAVLAVAWWLTGRHRRVRLLAAAAGLLGVWSTGWVIAGAVAGGRTVIVDFATTADPWYRLWSVLLPDYFNVTATTWVLHALWLTLLVAGTVGRGSIPISPVAAGRLRAAATRARGPRDRC